MSENRLLATIVYKAPNGKKYIKGFATLTLSSRKPDAQHKVNMIPMQELKSMLKSQPKLFSNATINSKSELKGVEGSLQRLPMFYCVPDNQQGIKIVQKTKGLTLFGAIIDKKAKSKNYLVMNEEGVIRLVPPKALIGLILKNKGSISLTNFKIARKGNGYVISLIRGNLPIYDSSVLGKGVVSKDTNIANNRLQSKEVQNKPSTISTPSKAQAVEIKRGSKGKMSVEELDKLEYKYLYNASELSKKLLEKDAFWVHKRRNPIVINSREDLCLEEMKVIEVLITDYILKSSGHVVPFVYGYNEFNQSTERKEENYFKTDMYKVSTPEIKIDMFNIKEHDKVLSCIYKDILSLDRILHIYDVKYTAYDIDYFRNYLDFLNKEIVAFDKKCLDIYNNKVRAVAPVFLDFKSDPEKFVINLMDKRAKARFDNMPIYSILPPSYIGAYTYLDEYMIRKKIGSSTMPEDRQAMANALENGYFDIIWSNCTVEKEIPINKDLFKFVCKFSVDIENGTFMPIVDKYFIGWDFMKKLSENNILTKAVKKMLLKPSERATLEDVLKRFNTIVNYDYKNHKSPFSISSEVTPYLVLYLYSYTNAFIVKQCHTYLSGDEFKLFFKNFEDYLKKCRYDLRSYYYYIALAICLYMKGNNRNSSNFKEVLQYIDGTNGKINVDDIDTSIEVLKKALL